MKGNILNKLRFVESGAVPKDGANESPENYERRQTKHAYFVEIYPKHLVEYNEYLKQAKSKAPVKTI